MKKLFTLMAIFALVLASCGNEDSTTTTTSTTLKIKNESAVTITDVLWNNVAFKESNGNETGLIGIWKGNSGDTKIELTISSEFTMPWTLLFNSSKSYNGTCNGVSDNTKDLWMQFEGTVGTVSLSGTNLILSITRISGQNGTYTLTRPAYQFVSGTNITKDVVEGSGYIFFKVDSNAYRTKELIIVEKNEKTEFVFNDYTLVIDVINPNETKTLGNL